MDQIPEGKTGTDKRTGQRVVRQGGQWVPLQAGGKPQVQEASMRGRMDLGLAPMVQAEQDMAAAERGGVNPLSRDWAATMIDGLDDNKLAQWVGVSTSAAAKKIGGQDYQDYTQAAKAFESQLMPIMSGAAVSPTEAARQIKAGLPEMGDTLETLQKKARLRQQMLNGAAKSRSLPLPYPDQPTWGINTMNVPKGGARSAPSGGAPSGGNDPLGIRRR